MVSLDSFINSAYVINIQCIALKGGNKMGCCGGKKFNLKKMDNKQDIGIKKKLCYD